MISNIQNYNSQCCNHLLWRTTRNKLRIWCQVLRADLYITHNTAITCDPFDCKMHNTTRYSVTWCAYQFSVLCISLLRKCNSALIPLHLFRTYLGGAVLCILSCVQTLFFFPHSFSIAHCGVDVTTEL